MIGFKTVDWTQIACITSIISLILGLFAAGLFIFCFVRHGYIGLTEQTPLCIKIAIRAGFITKKVSFPLCLWSLIKLVSSDKSALPFAIIAGLATCILLPLAAGVTILLSNTMQSDAAMVSLNNKNDLPVYLSRMLANLTGLIGQSLTSTTGALSLKILTLIILSCTLVYYMTNHNFLNQTFNNMFLLL